jgi:flagellar biosynthesis anti-sigma factor FlgM
MSISPIGSTPPITRLQGSKATDNVQGSQDAGTREADSVEISDSARYLGEINKLPDIRADKVNAAKALIASGQLESPERIDGTVEALLPEVT